MLLHPEIGMRRQRNCGLLRPLSLPCFLRALRIHTRRRGMFFLLPRRRHLATEPASTPPHLTRETNASFTASSGRTGLNPLGRTEVFALIGGCARRPCRNPQQPKTTGISDPPSVQTGALLPLPSLHDSDLKGFLQPRLGHLGPTWIYPACYHGLL